MQFTVEAGDLVGALAQVGRIVPGRSGQAALRTVQMSAQGGELTLTGTDGVTWITVTIPATVAVAGATALLHRYLAEWAALLPPEAVTASLSPETGMVTLRCARSEARLPSWDPADVPAPPAVTAGSVLTLRAADLGLVISRTVFCAAADDSRPIFTAAHGEMTPEGELTLVAADGWRLALQTVATDCRPATTLEWNLPAAALREAQRLLPSGEGATVELAIGAEYAALRWPGVRLVTTRTQGAYPDYRLLIPADVDGAAVNAGELAQAVRAVAFFDQGETAAAAVVVLRTLNNRELTVLTRSRPDGRAAPSHNHTTVDAVNYGPLHTALRAQYLRTALGVISAERVLLSAATPTAPVKLRGDPGWLHVIMPVFVSWADQEPETAAEGA